MRERCRKTISQSRIQSTTSRVSKCFRNNKQDTVWVGMVDYLDYSKELKNEWSSFETFVIKSKPFELLIRSRFSQC